MTIRRALSVGGQAAVVVAVGSLVVGSLLGQPILLGYVTSSSMQPTLNPGDGFVAVPTAIAGPIEEGDVVVFQAEEINGGRLTTHRVVEVTERGYITKGDANPFTDQASGEPPVKQAQIVAVALQVNGHVVVIPHLGTAVTGIQGILTEFQRRLAILLGTRALLGVQGLAYIIFALTLVIYVADILRGGDRKHRERDRSREDGVDPRIWIAAMGVVLVAGATAAMVVPAGTHEYGVVSAEFDSPGARVIPKGERETTTYRIGNSGVVPVISYVEPASGGVAVDPERVRVPPGGVANATVILSAPPQTGYYRRFVVEHRYLAVFPPAVIDALYRIHPWAPIVAVDGALFVGFFAIGTMLVGTGRVRDRSRDRPGGSPGYLRRGHQLLLYGDTTDKAGRGPQEQ